MLLRLMVKPQIPVWIWVINFCFLIFVPLNWVMLCIVLVMSCYEILRSLHKFAQKPQAMLPCLCHIYPCLTTHSTNPSWLPLIKLRQWVFKHKLWYHATSRDYPSPSMIIYYVLLVHSQFGGLHIVPEIGKTYYSKRKQFFRFNEYWICIKLNGLLIYFS